MRRPDPGLILTGAAIQGASIVTTFLLLAYAAGAATSLAVALVDRRPCIRRHEAIARRQ